MDRYYYHRFEGIDEFYGFSIERVLKILNGGLISGKTTRDYNDDKYKRNLKIINPKQYK